MSVAPAKRVRWTVKDYFRMAAAGLFDDRRVELIEGDIVATAAQGYPHQLSITRISRLLLAAFTSSDWVVIQGTLVLPRHGAPDPDFTSSTCRKERRDIYCPSRSWRSR
jgi:hypothetical protein